MPPRGHLYNLTGPEKLAMKDYIKEQLEKGFIRPSKSPAGAGFFFVKKKDGSLRPCIDYRALNNITVKNRYPLPLIDDLFTQVTGAQVFSKLDLRGAYNLVRIRQGDEWKTAFNTQDGHYEYLVMPFGLCNAPAVFQELVNEIFRDVMGKFLVVYLDDILIFSRNISEHRDHVRFVLQKLRQNCLYAKPEKCLFEVQEVPFLGYIISQTGLSMDSSKVAAVLNWPQPNGLKALQRFLGFSNYYRKFIRGYSTLVAPLTNLTKKGADPNDWSLEASAAFNQLKKAFCSAPILRHANTSEPFILEVDASEVGVGAVLSQYSGQHGRLHPCAFFSRKFSEAEKNYDIGNRELLAVKLAFEEWRHWLEGAKHVITVYTDHKNLEYIQGAKRLNPRQARWSLFFSRFDFIITYKPGSKNIKADALSRCFEPETAPPATPSPIIPEKIVISNLNSEEDLQKILAPFQADCPGEKPSELLFVPVQFRLQVLQWVHSHRLAGHPGVGRTRDLLSRIAWWPTWRTDVEEFIKSCAVCARCKPSHQASVGTLQSLPVPSEPWTHLSMDFIVDLPVSDSYTVIWVVVDRFSKMAHFVALPKLPTAKELADLFMIHVLRLHGVPENIVSDRGVQFVSEFWREFCKILGITLSFSSGFHPQTNGQTERVNQALEQYLRCYVSESQEKWVYFLPYAEFAHNNLRSSSSAYSPFQVVNGRSPKFTPLSSNNSAFPALMEWQDCIRKIWREVNFNLKKAFSIQKRQADRKRSPEWVFSPGDLVWVSTRHIALRQPSAKLGPKYIGPYPIEEKINDVTYRVTLPHSMRGVKSFHVSLLKPAVYTDSPPPPVVIDGEPEYEVERVLDSRWVRRSLQYLVHWKGYGPEERSWVPAHHLHADLLIQKFHDSHPDRPSLARSESTPQGRGNVTVSGLTSAAASASAAMASDASTLASSSAAPAADVSEPSSRRSSAALRRSQGLQPLTGRERARTQRHALYALRRRVT